MCTEDSSINQGRPLLHGIPLLEALVGASTQRQAQHVSFYSSLHIPPQHRLDRFLVVRERQQLIVSNHTPQAPQAAPPVKIRAEDRTIVHTSGRVRGAGTGLEPSLGHGRWRIPAMASSQGDVRPSPIDGIPAASIHPASGGWVPGRCQNSRYFHGQRRGLSPQTTAPEHDRVESCAITLKDRFRQISPWMRSSKKDRAARIDSHGQSPLAFDSKSSAFYLLERERARNPAIDAAIIPRFTLQQLLLPSTCLGTTIRASSTVATRQAKKLSAAGRILTTYR